MRIDTFRFGELSYFSKLLSDYTSHQLPAHLQLPYPLSLEGIGEQLKEPYPLKIDRTILSETILQQYQYIDVSAAVRTNIEYLKQPRTYTVVTAHQLSILGGPLYYVIKIANAISFARKLRAEFPDAYFVPVYWMGSEDHDFEEVNHIHLFGKKIVWETGQTGPVGRFSLENIDDVIVQVADILGENNPDNIQELIRKAYAHENKERASRELVNGLFGRYGLVIVNGDDTVLKGAVADIIQEEILKQPSYALLSERSEELKSAGYHAQATGRAINLFYLGDTFRKRISPVDGGGYEAGEKLYTEEFLLEEIRQYPENFSPNVVLRPVFQQSVLPNVAFIGGGGEIAYWMQLTSVFQHYKTRYPVLIPRTSLMLVNHANYLKFQKLHLEISDIFKDKDVLKREYLVKSGDEIPSLDEEKQMIARLMEKVKEKASETDKTLGPSAGADAQKIQAILEQIEGKMLRAVKQKNETGLKQIDSLYQSFFPENTLQERHDNFLNFYSRYGKNFIDWLVGYLSVIEQEFVVITETEKLESV